MGRESAAKLLAEIERSRAEFEAAYQARAQYLARRAMLYRLAAIWREMRRRYEHKAGRPLEDRRRGFKVAEEDRLKACQPHYSSYRKALYALRELPELAGAVALDEASKKIMLKAPMPLAFWDHGKAFPIRRLNADDIASLTEYLQSLGLDDLSRDDCLAAVRVVAKENAWSPG